MLPALKRGGSITKASTLTSLFTLVEKTLHCLVKLFNSIPVWSSFRMPEYQMFTRA